MVYFSTLDICSAVMQQRGIFLFCAFMHLGNACMHSGCRFIHSCTQHASVQEKQASRQQSKQQSLLKAQNFLPDMFTCIIASRLPCIKHCLLHVSQLCHDFHDVRPCSCFTGETAIWEQQALKVNMIVLLHRYIGIQEKEFEWLTEQLVSLANKYCQGRIVSALEGGYRIQGGVVSAFARSVASHVRALNAPTHAQWSWDDVKAEQQREKKRKVMSQRQTVCPCLCDPVCVEETDCCELLSWL